MWASQSQLLHRIPEFCRFSASVCRSGHDFRSPTRIANRAKDKLRCHQQLVPELMAHLGACRFRRLRKVGLRGDKRRLCPLEKQPLRVGLRRDHVTRRLFAMPF